jgi:hypothetical protein
LKDLRINTDTVSNILYVILEMISRNILEALVFASTLASAQKPEGDRVQVQYHYFLYIYVPVTLLRVGRKT